ncbi:hypothetical protein M569_17175 [Genlisea aurea]|uniref:Uncharacterized protein n=1 Tax=Genlisea aurea TaxID=192259 RepID=S8DE40_9LAMI|nr:hypothetical protein M569_17175 [Genlisea aurea]
MAKIQDEHVVEIQHHPLAEISRSPGHLLLLKLWQREEDLIGRRVASKEARKDAIGCEIFRLCCSSFLFHGIFFTILFSKSSDRCQKWWIPCVLSLCTCLVAVFLVQIELCRYWKVDGEAEKDRNECRSLGRRIRELRMKGQSFDLNREPQNGRKLKSSSVEIKWKPLELFSRYRLTVCLLCFGGLVVPSCRFIICI